MGILSGLWKAARNQVSWNNDPTQQRLAMLLLAASQSGETDHQDAIELTVAMFTEKGWGREEALNRVSHAVSLVGRAVNYNSDTVKVAQAIVYDIARNVRWAKP
jgi:hypothetical protein